MTSFRLNAGRPAPYSGSGPSARPEEAAEIDQPLQPDPYLYRRDTPLACGCLIPWPIIQEFGGHFHGQVLCSEHGYQPKITNAEVQRVRRETKKCQNSNQLPMSLDPCPF